MNTVVEPEQEAPKVKAKPRRPGAVLRDERKTQGLSIEEVAEELRLPPRYVDALEMGEYSKLPGDTFTRGYLRSYAGFLDIDSGPLLEAYARSTGSSKETTGSGSSVKTPKSVPEGRSERRSGFPVWAIGGVAVALILGAWLSGAFQSDAPSGSYSGMERGASVMDAAEPVSEPARELAVADSPTSPEARSELDEPTAVAEAANPVAEVAAVVAESVQAAGETPAPVETSADVLVIAFSEDCWIRVRDADGKTVSFGVKKAGEVLKLDSGAPFNLLIGNVKGVLVTLNGEPVDLEPYNDKNVAKLTLP